MSCHWRFNLSSFNREGNISVGLIAQVNSHRSDLKMQVSLQHNVFWCKNCVYFLKCSDNILFHSQHVWYKNVLFDMKWFVGKCWLNGRWCKIGNIVGDPLTVLLFIIWKVHSPCAYLIAIYCTYTFTSMKWSLVTLYNNNCVHCMSKN
jgi:hypothetical protein